MSCRSLASILDQDVVGTIGNALLTMHLPVRKPDDLTAWTAAAGPSNASPTYRFPSRNPDLPSTFCHGRLDRLLRFHAYNLCEQAASRPAFPADRPRHHRLHLLA